MTPSQAMRKLRKKLKKMGIGTEVVARARTGSCYMKFDLPQMGKCRFGDHNEKGRLGYRWQIRADISEPYEDCSKGHRRFFYPTTMLTQAAQRMHRYYQTIIESTRPATSLSNAVAPGGTDMPIPTKPAAPVAELSNQLTLLYGPPKIGKTTLAAGYPDACFLATEAGLGSVSAFRWESQDGRYVINSWDELLVATGEVVGSKRFKTLIIDTLGNACALCEAHICAKHGEEYKGDGKLGYGKGAALIINELKRYLTKLSSMGIGVVLVAHASQKTITTRTGEITKQVPHIPGDNKSGDIYSTVLGMCDLVLFCSQDGAGKRSVITKPHPTYDAGDRSGRLPETIELSYQALSQAWTQSRKPAAKDTKETKAEAAA